MLEIKSQQLTWVAPIICDWLAYARSQYHLGFFDCTSTTLVQKRERKKEEWTMHSDTHNNWIRWLLFYVLRERGETNISKGCRFQSWTQKSTYLYIRCCIFRYPSNKNLWQEKDKFDCILWINETFASLWLWL